MSSSHDRLAAHAAVSAALAALSDQELIELVGPRDGVRGDTGRAARLTGSPAAVVARYAGVATIVNDFYWRLYDGELTADYPAGVDRCGARSGRSVVRAVAVADQTIQR